MASIRSGRRNFADLRAVSPCSLCTKYDRPCSLHATITPLCSHRCVLGSCISTLCPMWSGSSSAARSSCHLACRSASCCLRAAPSCRFTLSRAAASLMGMSVRILLPRKSCAGEKPSARGVFLHSLMARLKLAGPTFFSSRFILFTAASARPFDAGLCGEHSSCVMSRCAQNSLNSPLNWGPPSVRMDAGLPHSRNQSSRMRVIAPVCRLFSLWTKGHPEKRSAQTR